MNISDLVGATIIAAAPAPIVGVMIIPPRQADQWPTPSCFNLHLWITLSRISLILFLFDCRNDSQKVGLISSKRPQECWSTRPCCRHHHTPRKADLVLVDASCGSFCMLHYRPVIYSSFSPAGSGDAVTALCWWSWTSGHTEVGSSSSEQNCGLPSFRLHKRYNILIFNQRDVVVM